MNLKLLFQPKFLIEKLAVRIAKARKLAKLHNTPAQSLSLGHIDAMELLELLKAEREISCIYDVGANTGTWTLLAKTIFPQAVIIAFEPLPIHISAFKENTCILDNVSLLPVALGNEAGKKLINVTSVTDASSLLAPTPGLMETYGLTQEESLEIEVARLDELKINGEKLPVPDLIKLDVQGYELEVLKGGLELLKKTKFVLMEVSFEEYYKDQPVFADIITFMAGINFHVKALSENTLLGKNLMQTDVLFKNMALLQA